MRKQYDNIYGFSLLEVLIASVLGSLLLTIVLQSYLSAKNIYRAQNELAYLSENIRSAEFILWQNIMQAGFAGCRKTSELNLTNRLSMVLGIRGYDSIRPPEYLLGKDIAKETDIIVIGKANAKATYLLDNIEKGATSFQVEQNPTTKGNHFLLISDCKNAELFKAKNWRAKTVYLDKVLNNTYKHINTDVRLFEEMTFFIKNHLDNEKHPVRSLYLSINHGLAQELISDVTDMQVQYVIDVKGSHRYLKAKNIIDNRLWDKVSSVIIDLKMRSQTLLKQRRIYIKLRSVADLS